MKKSIYWLLIVVMISALVVTIGSAGCKAQVTAEETTAAVETTAAAETMAAETTAANQEQLEFVCVAKGIHPWFDPAGVGMEDAAAQIGGINTRYMAPAEWSGEAQVKMVEDLVSQGVDGIAVAVFEAGAMKPAINEAMKQGVPIVIWDDDVADSDRVCCLATGNYEAGVMQGEMFVELMDYKANFIIWVQDLAARTVLDRVEGIRSVTKKYPEVVELSDVQMAGYGIDEALVTAESLLEAYPELNATLDVGMNGGIAMHRIMKERGIPPSDILNITWTLLPEIMEGLKEGYIYGSMRQNPYAMGYLATYALKWYIDGLRPSQEFIDMGKRFDTGIIYVDHTDDPEAKEADNIAKAPAMVEEFRKLWE
ncbi:MAG: sugar ABC transporter substrate-binding protein [Actinobacteria bacterium]|nr:sugar ABC transporter substrate-binding protein [Actinomycetota bacterium]